MLPATFLIFAFFLFEPSMLSWAFSFSSSFQLFLHYNLHEDISMPCMCFRCPSRFCCNVYIGFLFLIYHFNTPELLFFCVHKILIIRPYNLFILFLSTTFRIPRNCTESKDFSNLPFLSIMVYCIHFPSVVNVCI